MGEIRMPMTAVLKGKLGRLSPRAARVPKNVAMIVEKNEMMKLFFTAPCQFRLVKKSLYQRREYPSGSRVSISWVKEK